MKTIQILIRVDPDWREALTAWRQSQNPIPSEAKAIRDIVGSVTMAPKKTPKPDS